MCVSHRDARGRCVSCALCVTWSIAAMLNKIRQVLNTYTAPAPGNINFQRLHL